jgi:MoxR-like ATPase
MQQGQQAQAARSAQPLATGSDERLSDARQQALALAAAVQQVVVGQRQAIHQLVVAVYARGHVLLQGDVGVGKTTLLRAFARLIGGAFERIEGSVDLSPNDLLYHAYIAADGRPAVAPGPLAQHGSALAVFFFNEINRARPQVHALLLRAMAERSVTAFNRPLALPHLQVFADRNRLEREETYEIAQAARDRFMFELTLETPSDDAERRALVFDPRFHDTDALINRLPEALIDHRSLNDTATLIQREVQTSDALQRYALALWRATEQPAAAGVQLRGLASDLHGELDVGQLLQAGASPRGMSLLLRAARVVAWLDGRGHATPADLQAVFADVIGHRLSLAPLYELRRAEIVPALVAGILARVAAP